MSCGLRFAVGSGNHVMVSASQRFTFLTPFISQFFGGSLDLRASATGPVLYPIIPTVGSDDDDLPACPDADFDWIVPDETNAPRRVTFTDESTGTPTSWSWMFGDTSSESTLQDPEFVYPAAGSYMARLTVNGCSIHTEVVTVGSDPDPTRFP